MIKIRITLPLLIAILIAALVWLARDPDRSPAPHPSRPRRRDAAARPLEIGGGWIA